MGTAQITGAEASQLGRAKPAIAEHPQQGVVAFAGKRAAVRDAQQVRVVDVGQRLWRTGIVARDPHALHLLLATEIVSQRPTIDRYTRMVAGAAGRPPRPPALARWRA